MNVKKSIAFLVFFMLFSSCIPSVFLMAQNESAFLDDESKLDDTILENTVSSSSVYEENLVINENLKLIEDLVVKGDLLLEEGIVDLNGNKLIIIDEAIFSNVDLTNSFFIKTGGGHINFSYSNLENVKIIEADMVDCYMIKANLKNADMKMSELIGFNFEGANLEGTNFENSILNHSDFRGAIFNNVNFKGANLKKAVFLKKDIQNLDLDEEQKSVIIIEN